MTNPPREDRPEAARSRQELSVTEPAEELPLQERDRGDKKKDAWDKAQIVSGFLSSVVIAGVGILINTSIQRAQIDASKANTDAQIAVADRFNKSQLALSEHTAEIQRHIQESTLTGQLVEHLTSGSALKKRIAIIALRRSVPSDMYQDVISIIVRSDPDPEVRATAYGQAVTLRDPGPGIVSAIIQAAGDLNRSEEERQIAKATSGDIGLASASPPGSYLLGAAGSFTSLESGDLGGDVFTHFLLRGLSGEASPMHDGNVR
jgi:hypothetical protein